MSSILAPIESGAILGLDGRVRAQIERHDVAMDATVWSASATIDVPAVVRRYRPGFAFAEFGPFANLHWFFSEVASPVPYLKHARSRDATRHTPIVDGCCGTGPEQVRVPRDGLQTETGLTADGKRA